MSKYSDDLEKTFKDVRAVREATKSVIKEGSDLAFKEFQDVNSVERLKKELRKRS